MIMAPDMNRFNVGDVLYNTEHDGDDGLYETFYLVRAVVEDCGWPVYRVDMRFKYRDSEWGKEENEEISECTLIDNGVYKIA